MIDLRRAKCPKCGKKTMSRVEFIRFRARDGKRVFFVCRSCGETFTWTELNAAQEQKP
jgi:DNA-directed RNA polymerase subunit M/transcription elongation factor TFIIS